MAVLCWYGMDASGVGTGEDGRPAGSTIIDRFIEATGGTAAYEKIHNSVAKIRLTHVGMGFDDAMTEYHAEPNRRYVVIESDATGGVQQGTDGKTVWYLSEQTGPLIERDEARAAGLDQAAFDQVVHWRKYYKAADCVGEETIDGERCWKVVMTPNHGEAETRYYGVDSHLLVKATKPRLSSHMPTIRFDVTPSDYRWVDGLLIPHRVTQAFDMCGSRREMLFVTQSIEHNVGLPADRFDPPAVVKAAALAGSSSSGACCPGGEPQQGQGACGGGGTAPAGGTEQPKPKPSGGCGGGS